MGRTCTTFNRIFGRLRVAGLNIKDKKCNFVVNSCNYLGHVVGGGEVRLMDCRVKAVKEYERPKTKKQVRAFLGLCGVLSQIYPFILHCSKLLA